MLTSPRTLFRIVTALVCISFVSGCATYDRIADYPKPGQPTTVAVTAKPMSKMSELPLGAYYDDQRQIVISGHQKGMWGGMMFGLVGVLVLDEANKSIAEDKFGGSARSAAVDLGTITRELVDEAIASERTLGWVKTNGVAQLQLSPYAVFTVLKSGKARLYAMLRAEIPGPTREPQWSVRYFCRAPGEYMIEGNDGWMTDDRFAAGMRIAMKSALHVCAQDCLGRLRGTKTVTAKGPLAYMNNDTIPWRYIVVDESDDAIVARFAAGDVLVMAGTHVLDRSDHEIAPADFEDPRK